VTGNRVAVIGAGIVGVLCAWRLLKGGHEVTLVDRLPPGEGCSFGNACMISPDAVVPYQSPSSLLSVPKWLLDPLGPLSVRWADLPTSLPWLAQWVGASTPKGALRTGRGMAALHRGSLNAYARLLGEVGAPDLLRRNGQMQVSQRTDAFVPTRIAEMLREEFQVRTVLLGEGELRDLVPALSPAFKSGILFPNNGHTLSSARLVRTVAEHFQRHGGEILRREVRAFQETDGRLAALVLDQGSLPVTHAVIAAGVASRELLRKLNSRVLLQAERGYNLTLAEPNIALPMPVSNRDRSFAVTPMEDGIRFAGTVEIAGTDRRPDWRRAEILGTLGKEMFPDLKVEPATRWMGSRPSLPDGLPVLGHHPRLGNLLLAFGNGHYGMTAAPTMADCIAALVAGRPTPIEIGDYSLTRF
jgi:D-amino-acid dehydrogenase